MSAVLAYPGPAPSTDARLARRIVGFVRLVRGNGFPVGVREGRDAVILARHADLSNATEFHGGLRALLCSCQADWRRFDDLFRAYWLRPGLKRVALLGRDAGRGPVLGRPGEDVPETAAPREAVAAGDRDAMAAGEMARRHGASHAEALAAVDLRHINDPDELARIYDLTERLAARMRYRLSRRQRSSHRGRRLDLRNTIHRSLSYGGTPMRLSFRRRRRKQPRLVVLLDASGSMSLYTTFFTRFIRGVLKNFSAADAFVFHTRLVHVSPALRDRNVGRAVERLTLMSSGWGGGTRIGECLRTFNQSYAHTVLNSRSVVMIISDGYDTGPAELLAEQVRHLKRRAKRLIWLNPMMGWPGYEPLAGGMAAALPYLDLFAPAHNVDSLAALEPHLAGL